MGSVTEYATKTWKVGLAGGHIRKYSHGTREVAGGPVISKNRAPVAHLMSPCHRALLLPHISSSAFSISPQLHCYSWQPARPRRHEPRGQLEKDHSSGSVRRKIWKSGGGRRGHCVFPLFQQAATVWLTNWLLEGPVPIPVRVYWRWFWSPPWGHSSGAAICHLDCMAASLEGAPWLLIVYRLRCFRLHKGHMHRARWWAYTLIMSLYLCAGRSGTIRPPSGSPLLSASMLFLHKYSPLLQLSLA